MSRGGAHRLRPGPRQTRREIEALVAATGLDAQLKTFSLWDDFEWAGAGGDPRERGKPGAPGGTA